MAWHFVVSDEKLFVYVGNGIARDPKSRKSFGEVTDIKLGRARDEVVVKFAATRDGLHLCTKLFKADANDFCRSINNRTTTKEFATSALEKSGITSKQTEEIRIRRKRPIMPVIVNASNGNSKAEIRPLGMKDVPLNKISDTPKDLRLRDINMEWVQHLKNEIIQDPTVITTLPLLLKGDTVTSLDKVGDDATFYALGGCHLLSAIKSAETSIRSINAHIYSGLSNEEALKVASIHNNKMDHLPLSFQDKVKLGRRILSESGSDNLQGRLADMLTSLLGTDINRNSLSTIISVCKYGDAEFDLFRKVAAASEEKGDKTVNTKLFKLMQGCPEDIRSEALVRASENYRSAVKWLEEEKTRSQLRSIFVSQTGCKTWQEATDAYPEYAENLEKFKSNKITGKFIPQHITDFCNAAKEYRNLDTTAANVTVEINIRIGENIINNEQISRIINEHKNQIISQVQKNAVNFSYEE